MKLFVIILCLLSERYLIHSISYKRFIWFKGYCEKVMELIKQYQFKNPWLLLSIFILPIVFFVAILYFLLFHVFFGLAGFIISLFIFFYSLGPQNPFYPSSDKSDEKENAFLYFSAVNRQLFAPIFWYIFAGPIITLTYRLVTLCIDIQSTSSAAQRLTDIFEWLPARLSALFFLLVGNFQRGFPVFLQYIGAMPALNHQVLGECGLLAVAADSEKRETSIADAEHLVEQACIIFLVFIALFTLIAWL